MNRPTVAVVRAEARASAFIAAARKTNTFVNNTVAPSGGASLRLHCGDVTSDRIPETVIRAEARASAFIAARTCSGSRPMRTHRLHPSGGREPPPSLRRVRDHQGSGLVTSAERRREPPPSLRPALARLAAGALSRARREPPPSLRRLDDGEVVGQGHRPSGGREPPPSLRLDLMIDPQRA